MTKTPQHATFCAGNHTMGQTPCTVTAPPTPRTEDWKLTELFPVQPDGFTTDYCEECGVRVYGRHQQLHTSWHNKLLP